MKFLASVDHVGSSPLSQKPTIVFYITPFESTAHLHPLSLSPNIHFNIIILSTLRSLELSLEIYRPKICMHFSCPPCVLHAPFMSLFSIWSS